MQGDDRTPSIWELGDEEEEAWDEEDEAWEAAWEAADRHAAELLAEALADRRGEPPPAGELAAAASAIRAGLRSGEYPFDWIRRGAGIEGEPQADDAALLLECVRATIAPREETGLDPEEESAIIALEHADWLGSVLSAVRAGPGADASPDALVAGIYSCPEVDATAADPDDDAVVQMAFTLISHPWMRLGLIDEDERLTELGAWTLPRALASAWNADFDHPEAAGGESAPPGPDTPPAG